VQVGLLRDRGGARVDGEHRRRVHAPPPVEHPHPQHGLGLRDVVPPQGDRVATVDVRVGAGLSVGAETGLERCRRGRGAQAGVAVHVRGADPGLAEDAEGVVLLQKQLPGRVEPEVSPTSRAGQQVLRAVHDAAHGGVPVGLHEPVTVTDQRAGQPVGAVVGLPAVQILRIEAPAVDPVYGAAAHTDDPAVADGDVHRVAIGVQNRRRLHPGVDIGVGQVPAEEGVHPLRPRVARPVRCPWSPRVGDPVGHDMVPFPGGVGSSKPSS
jgi:hypothetical protein